MIVENNLLKETEIERVNKVFNHLNPFPLPIDFGRSLTSAEFMQELYTLLIKCIEQGENNLDEIMKQVDAKLEEMKELFLHDVMNDKFVEVFLDVMRENFKRCFDEALQGAFSFITFGLSEDGYLEIYIPEDMEHITFETDYTNEDYGKLVLIFEN